MSLLRFHLLISVNNTSQHQQHKYENTSKSNGVWKLSCRTVAASFKLSCRTGNLSPPRFGIKKEADHTINLFY
jgi:hypothetical protein